MARKKVSTTVYLTEEQLRMLRALTDKTKVPIAEYIRMGIDHILAENRESLPGQVSLFEEEDSFVKKEETIKEGEP